MRLAFLGLGVMGFPMAGHLQAAGHQVTVYNRTTAKAHAWVERYAGQAAATPREAAQQAEIVLVCVGNDNDVRSVVYGEQGALAGMRAGSVLIDHTTASAELARELAAAAHIQGVQFLDAPVSGGQAGAENAKLTIMVGGETAVFQQAEPVLRSYAKQCQCMGPVGSGQLCKMVNQILIAGLLQGLAEGIRFAQAAGLDVAQVVQVIGQGAAQSWQLDNRGVSMSEGRFNFGFALDWMRKDLAICLQQAQALGLELPVTALVDSYYAQLQAQGDGRLDTSALIKRL